MSSKSYAILAAMIRKPSYFVISLVKKGFVPLPGLERSYGKIFIPVTVGNRARGEGGTPLHGLYRYVRPQSVGFHSRFSHKIGYRF